MKWRNRLTNYNFWISMVSAILLLFQAFDFEFDILYVNEILTAILGLLVVVGIISDPTKTMVETKTETTEKKEPKASDSTDELDSKIESSKEQEIMPNVEENEINTGIVENDLQTIINKIATDLSNLRNEITPVSSSLQGVIHNESVEAKTIEDTTLQEERCHSIVND